MFSFSYQSVLRLFCKTLLIITLFNSSVTAVDNELEKLKEIVFAYNIINQHINECPSIRVSKVQTNDTFDEYFGYKIDDIILKIKSMGFESWTNTITNRQINF